MKKKDIIFTIGLTLFMGIIWIVGELVMGLWVAVIPKAHIVWFVLIVIITLSVSVWHSMKEGESGRKDPGQEKYERKVNRRKK